MNNISFNDNRSYIINQWINYLLIIYAFLIPLFKTELKFVASVILILWFFETTIKYKFELIKENKVIISFSLFVIYNIISLLWTNEPSKSYNELIGYMQYLPFVIIFTSLRKDFIFKLLSSFLFGMVVSEIITYGIYFDLWTTAYNDKTNSSSPTAFMGHTAYSLFVGFTSMLMLNKILFTHGKIKQFIFGLFFLSTFLNLIISGGRTGLLPFFISFLMYFILNYKILSFRKAIFTIGLILSTLILSYKNVTIFHNRIDQAIVDVKNILNGNQRGSFGARTALIQTGLEVSKENPIFGAGLKDHISLRNELILTNPEYKKFTFLTKGGFQSTHSHNEYIEILAQTGIVGLILFLTFLYYVLTIKIVNKQMYNIKIIFFIFLSFGITTSSMFHARQPMMLFALFIGLLLIYSKYEKQGDIDSFKGY